MGSSLDSPSSQMNEPTSRVGSCRMMLDLILDHPGRTIAVGGLGFAVGVLGWSTAYLIQTVLDRSHEPFGLGLIAWGILAAAIVRAIVSLFRRSSQLALVRRVERAWTSRALGKFLRLEMAHFHRFGAGELHDRLRGLVHVRHALEDRILGVVFDSVLVVIAGFVVARQEPMLAAFGALGALLPAMVVGFIRNSIRRSFEHTQKCDTALTRRGIDAFQGIEDLRIHGAEQWMFGRVMDSYEKTQSSRFKHLLKLAFIGNFTALLSTGTSILILAIGAQQLSAGQITAGSLMFAFTMAGAMLGPLENLVVSWIFFDDAAVALQRINEIAALPAESEGDSLKRADVDKDIRLEGVGFEYRSGVPVLMDVNLHIPRGATIAIVGESGAGKSTLLYLLAGLYRPQRGRILVGDRDLSQISLGHWRSNLGVVFQAPHLFEGTIEENIGLGTVGADGNRINEALRAAKSDGFVAALEENTRTIVGAGGLRLSAGQVQRLAIARALVRNPALLLLDEATSNLDAHTEASIWSALSQRSNEQTCVFVTHRLASSVRADLIVVLDQGRISETGTYSELMCKEGLYRRLWNRQMAGIADGSRAAVSTS